ncbi:hypothetical protein K4K53_002482 [Colletotrichum sp. SAR 10_77]|nr:hypothetical protein K4K53_002482 [Colletotrichum sp. SAR 10_77]
MSAWRAAHAEKTLGGNAVAQTSMDKTIETVDTKGDRADKDHKDNDLASVARGDPFETPAKYKMTIR